MPNGVQDSWITLLTIGYALVIVGVLVTILRRRRKWQDPGSHWLRNYCAILVLMALITGIGYFAIRHGHFRDRSQPGQQAQQAQRFKSLALKPLPARQAHFQWPLALGLCALVLLGGVWVVVRRDRRSDAGVPEAESVEEELARAIGSTIDDLRRERDARRAVIAAYANMERVLASHGLARGRAEVPYEYLARVLQMLHVRESAVRSLTELFEYAKFSPHEIDPDMKDRAIESLVRVKEDLQATRELAA